MTAPADEVSVVLENGEALPHDLVAYALGSAPRRMSEAELAEKSCELTAGRLGDAQTERLFESF